MPQKCPICSAENPADATSCHQCGFALGLEQSTWPDQEHAIDQPLDNDLDLGEVGPLGHDYPLPPSPPLSGDVAAAADTSIMDDEGKQLEPALGTDVASPDSFVERVESLDAPAPPDVPDWIRELDPAPAEAKTFGRTTVDGLQTRTDSGTSPVRPYAPVDVRPDQKITQAAFTMAILNAILVGGLAVICAGFMVAPFIGLLAGVRFRSLGLKAGLAPSFSLLLRPALIVGAGAWVGEMVGHPIWISTASPESESTLAGMLITLCGAGMFFAMLSVMATLFGGMVGGSKKRR